VTEALDRLVFAAMHAWLRVKGCSAGYKISYSGAWGKKGGRRHSHSPPACCCTAAACLLPLHRRRRLLLRSRLPAAAPQPPACCCCTVAARLLLRLWARAPRRLPRRPPAPPPPHRPAPPHHAPARPRPRPHPAAGVAPLEPGRHVVRRTVEGVPPFEDVTLPPGGAAQVLLTCRPGVVVDRKSLAKGQQAAVLVAEEVVAMPQQLLSTRV
jgi:hypothetical protein